LASSQGNTSAFNNLGAMHFNGDGVTKNYPEAARLFRQSAIKGDKYGQTSLGSMYLNGHGVDKDVKEAVKWFRLAAASGDVNAVNALKRLNQ
jgi:TPR repeat protein